MLTVYSTCFCEVAHSPSESNEFHDEDEEYAKHAQSQGIWLGF